MVYEVMAFLFCNMVVVVTPAKYSDGKIMKVMRVVLSAPFRSRRKRSIVLYSIS
jgi:hypothetical protein